jgi:adenylyltransferase/sulfurtransferase
MPTLPLEPGIQSRAQRAGYDPNILRDACVLIVGAGALGQNLAQNLALTGVRRLRLVDGDVFENHNRSRSPLHPRRGEYTAGDVILKATAVGHSVAAIHTDADAEVLVADTWIEQLGLGAFAEVDVIAACVDSLAARAKLARIALYLDIPIVDGGFSGPNLGMTVYPGGGDPETQPCWSCGGAALPGAFSCAAYAAEAETQAIIPAIQNGAAALGALCAEAVVSVLHGTEARPRRVALDLRTGESRVSFPQPDPECASGHRRLPEVELTEIRVESTVTETLEALGRPEALLFAPEPFVGRANCPGCLNTCVIGAPAHVWERDRRCVDCGGRWPRAEVQLPSPDVVDMLGHGSTLTLAQIGFAPGDVVELDTMAIRLAGTTRDLFTAV